MLCPSDTQRNQIKWEINSVRSIWLCSIFVTQYRKNTLNKSLKIYFFYFVYIAQ